MVQTTFGYFHKKSASTERIPVVIGVMAGEFLRLVTYLCRQFHWTWGSWLIKFQ